MNMSPTRDSCLVQIERTRNQYVETMLVRCRDLSTLPSGLRRILYVACLGCRDEMTGWMINGFPTGRCWWMWRWKASEVQPHWSVGSVHRKRLFQMFQNSKAKRACYKPIPTVFGRQDVVEGYADGWRAPRELMPQSVPKRKKRLFAYNLDIFWPCVHCHPTCNILWFSGWGTSARWRLRDNGSCRRCVGSMKRPLVARKWAFCDHERVGPCFQKWRTAPKSVESRISVRGVPCVEISLPRWRLGDQLIFQWGLVNSLLLGESSVGDGSVELPVTGLLPFGWTSGLVRVWPLVWLFRRIFGAEVTENGKKKVGLSFVAQLTLGPVLHQAVPGLSHEQLRILQSKHRWVEDAQPGGQWRNMVPHILAKIDLSWKLGDFVKHVQ